MKSVSEVLKNYKKKEKEDTDLGFGTKTYDVYTRFLNKDGTVNIKRKGLAFFDNIDIFHSLITMKWRYFLFAVFLIYFFTNLLFAFIYFTIDPTSFGNLENRTAYQRFLDLFFFSAQTLTTVGYGYIYPKGNTAAAIAALESLFGLLGFALATGLLYGRFSRPAQNFCFSNNILISPYRGITGLMFRVANKKQYELIEIEAKVSLSLKNLKTNKREFHFVNLERDKVNFLALNWTVVHPIDEVSPLVGMTPEDFKQSDAEIIILIKAISETFGQTVYSRTSYKYEDIVWGAKFKQMTGDPNSKGQVLVKVNEISDYELVKSE